MNQKKEKKRNPPNIKDHRKLRVKRKLMTSTADWSRLPPPRGCEERTGSPIPPAQLSSPGAPSPSDVKAAGDSRRATAAGPPRGVRHHGRPPPPRSSLGVRMLSGRPLPPVHPSCELSAPPGWSLARAGSAPLPPPPPPPWGVRSGKRGPLRKVCKEGRPLAAPFPAGSTPGTPRPALSVPPPCTPTPRQVSSPSTAPLQGHLPAASGQARTGTAPPTLFCTSFGPCPLSLLLSSLPPWAEAGGSGCGPGGSVTQQSTYRQHLIGKWQWFPCFTSGRGSEDYDCTGWFGEGRACLRQGLD